MKSPSGELLHLRAEAYAEKEHSGFTGALELYDELINFLGLSSAVPQPADSHPETAGVVTTPAVPPSSAPTADLTAATAAPTNQSPAEPSRETSTTKAAANSGALPPSGDVIKITGSLTGFIASRMAGAAIIVCGDCGNASENSEMFCIHCGGLLNEAASAEPATAPATGFCDDCGEMVESDEIFCPSCGSVMTDA